LTFVLRSSRIQVHPKPLMNRRRRTKTPASRRD